MGLKGQCPRGRARGTFPGKKLAPGGFLKVTVATDGSIRFEFFDELGKSLYHTVKPSPESLSVLQEDGSGLLRDHLLERTSGSNAGNDRFSAACMASLSIVSGNSQVGPKTQRSQA